jgi:nucleotide-binding universal stress UspA family protein
MKSVPRPSLKNVHRVPGKIVLATDLSCRCDRALDRAVQVTKEWDGHLTAVTVVEDGHRDGFPPERRIERAERHLQKDASMERDFSVRVRAGDVTEQLLAVVSETEAELIVTGVARNQLLRAVILGSVVNKLLQRSPVPILVVRNRARGGYRRVVVAGDLSDLSFYLLQVALLYFPEAKIDFLHAFETPYLGLANTDREIGIAQARANAQEETLRFREKLEIPPDQRERINIVCDHGAPVAVLHDFLEKSNADLVIIGNHGRNVLFEVLIGSTATQILQDVDCDVLVVPERLAATE